MMLVKKLTVEECKEALDRERAATAEFEAEIAYKDLCLQAAIDIVRSGTQSAQEVLAVLTSALEGKPPRRYL